MLLTKQRQNEVLVPFFIVTQTRTRNYVPANTVWCSYQQNMDCTGRTKDRTGDPDWTRPDGLDQTPDQTGPDQTNWNGPDQSRPDQTGPDQTRQDQTGPDRTGPDRTGPPDHPNGMSGPDQTGPYQTGPTDLTTRPGWTRPDRTGLDQTRPDQSWTVLDWYGPFLVRSVLSCPVPSSLLCSFLLHSVPFAPLLFSHVCSTPPLSSPSPLLSTIILSSPIVPYLLLSSSLHSAHVLSSLLRSSPLRSYPLLSATLL